MAKSKLLISDAVTRAVFLPTAVAYFSLLVGYIRTGLALYFFFIIAAYLLGWFKRIREWSLISKITLACGPPLLGLGYFFSTENATDGSFALGLIYCVLSLVGGYALQRLD